MACAHPHMHTCTQLANDTENFTCPLQDKAFSQQYEEGFSTSIFMLFHWSPFFQAKVTINSNILAHDSSTFPFLFLFFGTETPTFLGIYCLSPPRTPPLIFSNKRPSHLPKVLKFLPVSCLLWGQLSAFSILKCISLRNADFLNAA